MWVLTTTGSLINVAGARDIYAQESFEFTPKEAMEVIAHFHSGERITLAIVTGEDRELVTRQGLALFQRLVEKIAKSETFCDLKAPLPE